MQKRYSKEFKETLIAFYHNQFSFFVMLIVIFRTLTVFGVKALKFYLKKFFRLIIILSRYSH